MEEDTSDKDASQVSIKNVTLQFPPIQSCNKISFNPLDAYAVKYEVTNFSLKYLRMVIKGAEMERTRMIKKKRKTRKIKIETAKTERRRKKRKCILSILNFFLLLYILISPTVVTF